jgi:hypothetical protein
VPVGLGEEGRKAGGLTEAGLPAGDPVEEEGLVERDLVAGGLSRRSGPPASGSPSDAAQTACQC